MAIKIKRIYDAASADDGYRILVDRLWPRGIKKEYAKIDKWLKDVAPSSELRKWFNHEPEKWKGFVEKYADELKGGAPLDELKLLIKNHKNITLVFSAKDKKYNQAVALLKFI